MSPELADYLRTLRARQALRPASPPLPELPELPEAVIRQTPVSADLPACFSAAARRAGWSVHTVPDAPSALRRIGELLQEERAGRVLVEATDAGVCASLAASGFEVVTTWSTPGELFALDATVTEAVVGVAETGSVLLDSRPPRSRSGSLVPPVLIVRLSVARLRPDLLDVLGALRPEDLPSNLNLITGPSKTADIEGVLITGVHGPGRVHVILEASGAGD